MSNVIHPNEFEFNELLNREKLVLVDFFATWCAPCMLLNPQIEKLAKEFEGKVKIIKVDIDKEKSIAARYGIQSIPNLMLFKDGHHVSSKMGFQAYPMLVDMLLK